MFKFESLFRPENQLDMSKRQPTEGQIKKEIKEFKF